MELKPGDLIKLYSRQGYIKCLDEDCITIIFDDYNTYVRLMHSIADEIKVLSSTFQDNS